jgi:Zn-dependent protease
MSLVALAGPFSNMVLALLFMVALKFFLRTGFYNSASEVGQRSQDFLPRVLGQAVAFNALLAVFNLLPIPPLDGSRIMAWLLPEGIRAGYVALERFGLVLVFGLINFSPTFQGHVYGAVDTFVQFLDRLVPIPF